MTAHLCDGLVSAGHPVDLLVIKEEGSALASVPAAVRRIKVGNHAATSLPRLVQYLRQQPPKVLLASKHRANRVAVKAREIAASNARLCLKIETHLSASLAHQNAVKRAIFKWELRRLYGRAHAVIGVSQGVCEDLRCLVGESVPVHLVYNPVLPRELLTRAQERVRHQWFREHLIAPIIVAAGRLTRQKDFATLLRAFAQMRERSSCRLLVLGEGPERARLVCLANELDIADSVDFLGFVENPFPYIRQASLFVLSSAWEGFGNVLVEAMALGTPVVSTDCPSGPREILQNGVFGPLVKVGDPAALAGAMTRAIESPVDGAVLRRAADEYSIEKSTARHLQVLFPSD